MSNIFPTFILQYVTIAPEKSVFTYTGGTVGGCDGASAGAVGGHLTPYYRTRERRGLLAIDLGDDVLFEHPPILAIECLLEILAEFVERGARVVAR